MAGKKGDYRRRLVDIEIRGVRGALPKCPLPYDYVAGELGISSDDIYGMIGGQMKMRQDTASRLYGLIKENAENGEVEFLRRLKKTRPRDPLPEELPRDPPKSALERSALEGRDYVNFSDVYGSLNSLDLEKAS